MILQIERKEKRTYVDGITSINVHHKKLEIKEGADRDKIDYYAFNSDKGDGCDKTRGMGHNGKIRLFRCYDEIRKREWFIATDCICFLLNDEGKTISRYAENTLS